MKNLSNSYQAKPQDYLFEVENDNPTSAFTQGLYHQVEDWVALELTAEQMLGNHLDIVITYVAGDAKQMWQALKDCLLPYELATEDLFARAAGANSPVDGVSNINGAKQ